MFGKISTEFLNDLGYDVIAHPQEGIDPLLTLIHYNAESLRLWGPIGDLTQEATIPLPLIQKDLQATGVSGGTTADWMLEPESKYSMGYCQLLALLDRVPK